MPRNPATMSASRTQRGDGPHQPTARRIAAIAKSRSWWRAPGSNGRAESGAPSPEEGPSPQPVAPSGRPQGPIRPRRGTAPWLQLRARRSAEIPSSTHRPQRPRSARRWGSGPQVDAGPAPNPDGRSSSRVRLHTPPFYGTSGMRGMTSTNEIDHGLASCRKRSLPSTSPALGNPVAT